jgi:hypothetical protein
VNILYQPGQIAKRGSIVKNKGEIRYLNHRGELHREDGAAIIREDNLSRVAKEEYYFNGKLHRSNGPALLWSDGSFSHYQNGLLAGGAPTVFRSDSFLHEAGDIKEEWRNEKGELDRSSGPAQIFFDGTLVYYRNGKKDRADGPAIERPDSVAREKNEPSLVWMQKGKRHRSDGPALLYPCGAFSYYENDLLHRSDGPAVVAMDRISPLGYREGWLKHGAPDRKAGPALIDASGTCFYYLEGVLHRTDGPAIESADGKRDEYYLEGMLLNKRDWERDRLRYSRFP